MPGPAQHTVQKKLLSQFTSTPNQPYKKQKIWIHDKKRNFNFQKNISKVTKVPNFLEKDADDNITKLEKEIFPILDKIQKGGLIYANAFSEDDREENLNYLYRYIAMQLIRTPNFREKLKKNYPNLPEIDLFLKKNQSGAFNNHVLNLKFINFGFGRANSRSKGQYAMEYYRNIKKFSKIPPLTFDIMAASLMDISLPVVIINNTRIPFIQNDLGLCPYFPLGETKLNIKYSTADGPKLDILCVFPLSPKKIICCCTLKSYDEWYNSIDPTTNRGAILGCFDEEDIRRTNQYIYEFSQNLVFSNIKFEEGFIGPK